MERDLALFAGIVGIWGVLEALPQSRLVSDVQFGELVKLDP
jgi:hypothetical protein